MWTAKRCENTIIDLNIINTVFKNKMIKQIIMITTIIVIMIKKVSKVNKSKENAKE